jgi:hypothetical protein
MTIRFEVAPRKTYFWKHFVARAKKRGRHRVDRTGLHVVVCKTIDAALEIWQVTRSWTAVWYYVDGRVVGKARFKDMMHDHQFRDQKVRDMLQDVLDKHHRGRGRGDDEGRWRMGLGPDPKLGF